MNDYIDREECENDSGAFDYERERFEADELLAADPGYFEWLEMINTPREEEDYENV